LQGGRFLRPQFAVLREVACRKAGECFLESIDSVSGEELQYFFKAVKEQFQHAFKADTDLVLAAITTEGLNAQSSKGSVSGVVFVNLLVRPCDGLLCTIFAAGSCCLIFLNLRTAAG